MNRFIAALYENEQVSLTGINFVHDNAAGLPDKTARSARYTIDDMLVPSISRWTHATPASTCSSPRLPRRYSRNEEFEEYDVSETTSKVQADKAPSLPRRLPKSLSWSPGHNCDNQISSFPAKQDIIRSF